MSPRVVGQGGVCSRDIYSVDPASISHACICKMGTPACLRICGITGQFLLSPFASLSRSFPANVYRNRPLVFVAALVSCMHLVRGRVGSCQCGALATHIPG